MAGRSYLVIATLVDTNIKANTTAISTAAGTEVPPQILVFAPTRRVLLGLGDLCKTKTARRSADRHKGPQKRLACFPSAELLASANVSRTSVALILLSCRFLRGVIRNATLAHFSSGGSLPQAIRGADRTLYFYIMTFAR